MEIEQYDEQYPIGGPDLKAFKLLRQAQQAKRVRADSPYILSVWMQIRLCMTRGLQRLRNDASIAIVTIIGSTIITLLLATLFINRPNNTRSFYTRGSLLFFSILMNAFATSPEILTLYIQRPVVEKQSGQYAFYHAYAEALALMVVDLPTQGYNIPRHQHSSLLLDQSSTRARGVLPLPAIFVHVHPGHVHDLQDAGLRHGNDSSSHAFLGDHDARSHHVHWLHRPNL